MWDKQAQIATAFHRPIDLLWNRSSAIRAGRDPLQRPGRVFDMRLNVPIPILSRGRAGRTTQPVAAPLPSTNGVYEDETIFSEELLNRLRRLTLISRKSIAEGLAGEHRSRRRGSSPEFADFKSYSQGDDFRRIDWNIYGRLDEVFVRLSEVTTELTVHVLLDASNSMDWR